MAFAENMRRRSENVALRHFDPVEKSIFLCTTTIQQTQKLGFRKYYNL